LIHSDSDSDHKLFHRWIRQEWVEHFERLQKAVVIDQQAQGLLPRKNEATG